jgi:hypothetical protein
MAIDIEKLKKQNDDYNELVSERCSLTGEAYRPESLYWMAHRQGFDAALNTVADQSRVIAVLTEALRIYQSSFPELFHQPCRFEQYLPELCRTHNYEQCPVEIIKKALVEAQRIQEGK